MFEYLSCSQTVNFNAHHLYDVPSFEEQITRCSASLKYSQIFQLSNLLNENQIIIKFYTKTYFQEWYNGIIMMISNYVQKGNLLFRCRGAGVQDLQQPI